MLSQALFSKQFLLETRPAQDPLWFKPEYCRSPEAMLASAKDNGSFRHLGSRDNCHLGLDSGRDPCHCAAPAEQQHSITNDQSSFSDATLPFADHTLHSVK